MFDDFFCYNFFMQNKINYQSKYDLLTQQLKQRQSPPSLLLHCCCAPCASHCLTLLAQTFDVTAYFFNPNIFPPQEYTLREQELLRLTKQMLLPCPVNFISGEYQPQSFFDVAKGLETAPEGGKRCYECFYLRLKNTARQAKQNGFEYFCTTLTISPLKDAQLINEIGQRVAQEEGVKWLPADFKKQNGYLHSIKLSEQYGLYRQDYCGCVFSKRDERVDWQK